MNRGIAGAFLVLTTITASCLLGQDAVKSASASPKPASSKPAPTQNTAKPAGKSDAKNAGLDLKAGTNGPITTEIFADEAFFDSNKSMGIFRGQVKVNDPRFSLQSDKLTVFISKAQANQTGQSAEPGPTGSPGEAAQTGKGQGLERAIAEGNVAVVRDRPDPNGGPPTRAVGRAETATYVAASGDVELKGNPRVQQGLNTHIATSPDTVMIINQSGQLTTHGPSRTEIRQEPKDEKEGGEKRSAGKGEKESKSEKGIPSKSDNKAPQSSPKP